MLSAGAVLLSVAAAGEGVLRGDVLLARWVQASPESVAAPLSRFADWVGSIPTLLAAAATITVVLLIGRHYIAPVMLGAALLGRALNPLIKDVVESPRPPPDLVRVTERASGSGFPSGHVMGVVLLYGSCVLLAHQLVGRPRLRLLIQGAATAIVVTTGLGRIYTGAHWPSDVLGGYLWGGVVLLVVVRGVRLLRILSQCPD